MRDARIGSSGAVIAIGVVLGAAAASAEPHVVGVAGGIAHSAIEVEQEVDARGTIGLFGRRGFAHRWALQLDLARVRHDVRWDIYTATASVLHAFGSSPWLVPMVRAGVGWDEARGARGSAHHGVHAEAGAALELRLDGGFVVGAELGVGWRGPPAPVCLAAEPPPPDDRPGVSIGGCDAPLYHTTYRAAKLTLGIAF